MIESTRQEPSETSRLEKGLLGLVLAVSLLLRLTALDVFLTIDERTWRERSLSFYSALTQRDLQSTYQSEHPGVMTMWVGTLAAHLSRSVEALDLHSDADRRMMAAFGYPRQPGVPELTLWARRIVACVTWLGIVVVYLLLRHLVGSHASLIATALFALDPFLIAHSRLHHVDALLTTFSMLSVVSSLTYCHGKPRIRYMMLSGAMGGLAMISKSPGVYLVPWTACALAVHAWGRASAGRKHRVVAAARGLLLWGAMAMLVMVAFWPALRAAPSDTLDKIMAGIVRQVTNPHELGNFFWFKRRPDPGPGFYPVVWLFRTTPWVMVGLVALAVTKRKSVPRETIYGLLLFILGYCVFMTCSKKKFDRYLLPVFPLFDLLAAVGYVALLHGWELRQRARNPKASLVMLATVVTLGQAGMAWMAHPYYLAYYNPLVGGAKLAPQVLLYGWGEGLEKAAAYLNSKPNAQDLHVVSQYPEVFQPFFVGHTIRPGRAPLVRPDYFVLYASSVQRKFLPEVQDRFWDKEQPEYVASLNGLEYAWVYPNTFYRSEAMRVLSYIENGGDADRDVVLLNTNANLRRYYQGPLSFSTVAGPARDDFVLNGLQKASIGRDRIWFLTFPETHDDTRQVIAQHLEGQASRVDKVTVDGVSATCYELHEGARFVPPEPSVRRELCLGQKIHFLGYDLPTARIAPGGTLSVRFYWQARQPIGASYKVFRHLVGPDGQRYGQVDSVPQGYGRPTSSWLPGETILDDCEIEVSSGALPGNYTLEVGMYDPDTMDRLPVLAHDGRRLEEDRFVIEGLHLAQ